MAYSLILVLHRISVWEAIRISIGRLWCRSLVMHKLYGLRRCSNTARHRNQILLCDVVPIWRGFARPFLQRRAVGRHRLLQMRRPALPLPEPPIAHCRDLSASSPSRAEPVRASFPPTPRGRPPPPPPTAPSRSPAPRALESALPRFICIVAQLTGTRLRRNEYHCGVIRRRQHAEVTHFLQTRGR